MKKRHLYSLIAFPAFSVLILLFQNFDSVSLKKLIPRYSHYEYFGNLQVPVGLKEKNRLDSLGSKEHIIFNEKAYLKNLIHDAPLYDEVKDFFDLEDFREDSLLGNKLSEEARSTPCNSSPCSSALKDLRLRVNPYRSIASVSLDGDISTKVSYGARDENLQIHLNKTLDKNTSLRLQIRSKDQSGTMGIDLSW